MKRIKEGNKVQSCIYIDSEIKLVGHMIARARDMNFSEFVELLILEQYLKDMELLEREGYINE